MVRLRVRIRFCKQGDLRFIGHRDLMRCLERLFRRAGLALSFSQGFHPKPRMTFPLALAVGIEGVDEVMEVELAESYTAEELLRRLSPQAPPGLVFRTVEVLPDGGRKAQVAKRSPTRLPIPAPCRAALGQRIERLLAAASWPIERHARRAPIDLRPLVCELALREGVLRMRLRVDQPRQRRSARRAGRLGLGRPRAAGSPSAPHGRGDLRMTAMLPSAAASARLQRMRTGRYCRTRKQQHETGNADQRRAAGRMPDRDR